MDTPRSMPVGYRFHPNDEELVSHYLKLKLLGHHSSVENVIAEIDVCNHEPWDLPAFSKEKSDDHEWFFFSPISLKFREDTKHRRKRRTKAGYWKPTGKDRNVKTRGTNDVVGTKKTLVFYKGPSSKGVKTNWVIHEYHAVTFPDDKRGFVLCRLIEKEEKKIERRTNVLIHDEGEPSHIAADSENQATADRITDIYTLPELNPEPIFPTPPQADEYSFPSLQQSNNVTEQEPSFQGSAFPNAYFAKEISTTQIPFETIEEEDNLDDTYIDIDMYLNELAAGEDAAVHQETIPASVIDSTQKNVYNESLETSAEPLSAQHGNILGTSSLVCNEHNGSREKPLIPMVKSLHDAVYASPPPVSSRDEVNLIQSTSDDDFWGLDAFSDITPLPMFLIQSVSPAPSRARSPSPSRRRKTTYHPMSINSVSLRADTAQESRKIYGQCVPLLEAQKETLTLESVQQQREVPGTSAWGQSLVTGVAKGSFSYLETLWSMKLLQHDNIPDTTSSMSNEHTDPKENLVTSTVQSPHNEANIEKKDITSDDEFGGLDAYVDSILNEPLSICTLTRITTSSLPSTTRSPSPLRSYQNEYHPRSRNFVSLRVAAGKSQTKRNSIRQVAFQQEALKETHVLVLKKVQRKAKGTSSGKKFETMSNLSPDDIGIGKGSFIHLETPLVQRSWSLFTWSCGLSGCMVFNFTMI